MQKEDERRGSKSTCKKCGARGGCEKGDARKGCKNAMQKGGEATCKSVGEHGPRSGSRWQQRHESGSRGPECPTATPGGRQHPSPRPQHSPPSKTSATPSWASPPWPGNKGRVGGGSGAPKFVGSLRV